MRGTFICLIIMVLLPDLPAVTAGPRGRDGDSSPRGGFTGVGKMVPLSRPADADSTAPSPRGAGTRYIGINGGGPLDWEGNQMFADAIKSCREFRKPGTEERAAVDSGGWPTEDFEVYIWAGVDRMNGKYALSFRGRADVSPALSHKIFDPATNTTTGTIEITETGESVLEMSFSNTRRTAGSAVNTGITDISLMRPIVQGAGSSYPPGTLLTDQYRTAMSHFKVNRFMDFVETNGNTTEIHWSDRMLPDWPRQAEPTGGGDRENKGGAWEYVILIANELNMDCWINIPAAADDDYITKLARLFRYGSDGFTPYTSPQPHPKYPPLNSNLKLYVEYSNELWNFAPAFTQGGWNHDAAVAEINAGSSNLDYDGNRDEWVVSFRRVARETVDISKIFRSVFGDSEMMTRVRPVFAWQQGNAQDTACRGLTFIDEYYGNRSGVFVSDPRPVQYYIWGGGGSAYYGPDNESDSLTINNIWDNDTFSLASWRTSQYIDASYCAAYGIRRAAYEGGPGMDNYGHSESVKREAWHDPRMKTEMTDHHEFWEEYNGDLLLYFCLGGTDINSDYYYQWSFAINIFDPVTDSPKMQAIVDLNGGGRRPANLGAAVPGAVDGAAFDLADPSWASSGTGPLMMNSGADDIVTASYNFVTTRTGTIHTIINYSSAGSAELLVFIDNIEVGAISTGATGPVDFTSPAVPAEAGTHGVRLYCKSGPITINSIRTGAGPSNKNIGIFRPDSGLWAVKATTRAYFGGREDRPIYRDYDGDGKEDIGIFRPASGLWAIRSVTRVYFGGRGDVPVPADYTGDSRSDIGIFRPASGLWAVRSVTRVYFGSDGDEALPSDYNGDGSADIGIFRNNSGLWAVRSVTRAYFGGAADRPVPGDYTGDGTEAIGIFRPDQGLWVIRGMTRDYFGGATDEPIPGDYDGDGTEAIGIFGAAGGLWAIRAVTRCYFGGAGDIPVAR